MLRKADVKTWEMNEQAQKEMIKKFNKQRDEKLSKMEAARVINPFGSYANPPDNRHRENYSPSIYDNMPGASNKQPTIAPPSQDSTKHLFVIGSRVEFSDPPRYGEICWMGTLPQVNGLIAGLELVS